MKLFMYLVWAFVPSDQALVRHYFLEQLNKPEYIWGIRVVCVMTAVLFIFLYQKLKRNMEVAEAVVYGGVTAVNDRSESIDNVPVIEIAFTSEPTSVPEPALVNIPEPEPVFMSEPEPGIAATTEPEPEVAAMPVSEPEPEIAVMPVSESEPEIAAMPVSEPEPEIAAMTETEAAYEPQTVPIYEKASASKTALASVLEFVPAPKSVLEQEKIPAPKSVLEQEDIPELKFVSERGSITKHAPKKEDSIKSVVKQTALPKVPELNADSNSLLWAVVGVSVSVSVSVSIGSMALLSAYRRKRRVA